VRGFELEDERELYGLAELMKKGLQVDAHSHIEFCFTFTLTVFCGLSAAEGLRINPAP
jgi:hypothetical protein